MLLRGTETIIPSGKTIIHSGDTAILSALAFEDAPDLSLLELHVADRPAWIGKTLAEITLSPHQLVILMKRNGRTIFPKGNTFIKEDDIMVLMSK